MKKIIRKIFEIGALLLTGIVLLMMIWDYVYIPSNLGILTIILGVMAMMFYIVSLSLDS